jgi:outer membrane lipoprotein-sorting protein
VNDRHKSDHDDALERAMRAYHSESVPDGPPSPFVAEVLAALHHAEEAVNPSSTISLKERILAMRRTTKIAIAATVLIALGGLLAWLALGGDTALALTDVAEAVANVRTATCKVSIEVELSHGKETTSGKMMYLAPSRERHEFPRIETTTPEGTGIIPEKITIQDTQKGISISLLPETKTAMVFTYENVPADSPGNTFEHLRRVVGGQAEDVEQLGRRTVDGRETVGFRYRVREVEMTIWADPGTGLPVRVEATTPLMKPKSHVVWSDFRFNVELDESLFSLEVPEGYTVKQDKIDASEPTLDELIQVLRVLAELNDGTFPADLHDMEGIYGIISRALIAKLRKGEMPNNEEAIGEGFEKETRKLFRGLAFANALAPENDPHYAGKDVKLNTPDRPIFWYKPTDSEKYRVVYADLSVQDVAPEDLPKEP